MPGLAIQSPKGSRQIYFLPCMRDAHLQVAWSGNTLPVSACETSAIGKGLWRGQMDEGLSVTCRMRWQSFSSIRVRGTVALKDMPPVFFFLK